MGNIGERAKLACDFQHIICGPSAREYHQKKLVAAMMAHPSCGTARREELTALGGTRDAERIPGR